MGTSVVAYFVYNIRASNLLGASNFSNLLAPPPGQWIQKVNTKACVRYTSVVKADFCVCFDLSFVSICVFGPLIATFFLDY